MNSEIHNLEISIQEKRKLRHNKIRFGTLHTFGVAELQKILNISRIRAMELSAMSEFQSLPSIGPRFAQDLISMGYYSLKELKGKDGARLLDKFEKQVGVWADPCLEDQFRMVVHFANHPGLHKNWWDFTPERKAFREKNGYPASRPTKAWYELPQYQRASRVSAAKEDTKKELAARLRHSVRFMNKHYGEDISLTKLAEAAAVSTHHFLRQFKNVYEITPMQYLTNVRLKKATGLLRATDLPVGEIGQHCGFENESSFIRLFKSQFAKTPLQFRKKFRSAHVLV